MFPSPIELPGIVAAGLFSNGDGDLLLGYAAVFAFVYWCFRSGGKRPATTKPKKPSKPTAEPTDPTVELISALLKSKKAWVVVPWMGMLPQVAEAATAPPEPSFPLAQTACILSMVLMPVAALKRGRGAALAFLLIAPFFLWVSIPPATAGRLADAFTSQAELDRAAADRERAEAEAARTKAEVDINRARAAADLERQGYLLDRARGGEPSRRGRGVPLWFMVLTSGAAVVSLVLYCREEERRKRAEMETAELRGRLSALESYQRPPAPIPAALEYRGGGRR